MSESRTGRFDGLFGRFQKDWDTYSSKELSLCYQCPHASSYESAQELSAAVAPLYATRPNYRDGKLIDLEYRPTPGSAPCRACFEGWVEDKRDQGKICGTCGRWLGKPTGMIVETRDAGTKKLESRRVVLCEKCFSERLDAAASSRDRSKYVAAHGKSGGRAGRAASSLGEVKGSGES